MGKSLSASDIVKVALNGGNISMDDALSTYANPENWGHVYDEKGCHWVWKGPVICAYELADIAIRHNQK